MEVSGRSYGGLSPYGVTHRRGFPFSKVVAIAYEYPCTLGKQQEGLHRSVVFSSTTGIPLITPALSGRLRLQDQRRGALELLMTQKDRVGYVGDEVCGEDGPNPDIVPNRWNRPGHHYECHHPECVVTGTAKPYSITEEEYLAHWNAFHAAVSPGIFVQLKGATSSSPGSLMHSIVI